MRYRFWNSRSVLYCRSIYYCRSWICMSCSMSSLHKSSLENNYHRLAESALQLASGHDNSLQLVKITLLNVLFYLSYLYNVDMLWLRASLFSCFFQASFFYLNHFCSIYVDERCIQYQTIHDLWRVDLPCVLTVM